MAVKRTSKEKTTPVVFQIPTQMIEEMQNKRSESEKGTLGKIEELHSHFSKFQESFTNHRLQYQSDNLKSRNASKEDKESFTKVTAELEEAFDILWPKFETLEASLKKSIKDGDTSLSKVDAIHTASIAEHASQILELSKTVEKRHQSALKKLNQIDIPEYKPYDDAFTKGEIKRLELLIKEVGKYEYGSSLNILSAGTPVGFTGILNFKSGFTVVINGAQIDITANAGGGGTQVDNEVVSGSGTTFTLANTPLSGTVQLYGEGQRLTPGVGNDYTISGKVITTANSFGSGTILADYQH